MTLFLLLASQILPLAALFFILRPSKYPAISYRRNRRKG